MQLSSQGLNFLGLTARKYETANISNNNLKAVHKKLEAFEQVSNGFAHTTVALNNLKDLNCQAYCVIDGKKEPISEKSWDRGGVLEGKVPLEEGIAKGLYHIENIKESTESIDLDSILKSLQAQAASDAVTKTLPKEPSKDAVKNFQSKFDVRKDSSFKFIS